MNTVSFDWYMIVSSFIALLVTVQVYRWVSRGRRALELRRLATRKRTERDSKREKMRAIVKQYHDEVASNKRELIVQSNSVIQLLANRRAGKISAVDMISIFSQRALLVGHLTHNVTEEFYEEARQYAQLSDSAFRLTEGKSELLLDGIPLSVKDQFYQKGADSTCGLASRCFQPAKVDGLLIELLRDAGCIPFVRSNVPQSLMQPESVNNVWGAATNPFDPTRTSGGSSGGEGGLVGAGASILGVGTDIGGSVRIPAHYNGVYGFKPTAHRLSKMGLAAPNCRRDLHGQDAIRSAAGVISHGVEDIVLVMRAWLVDKMWQRDPYIPRLPFRLSQYRGVDVEIKTRKKLRVAWYDSDGYMEPSPACKRAVHEAVAALKNNPDIELVSDWRPYRVDEAVALYFQVLTADGGMQSFLEGLDGEDLHDNYKLVYRFASLPASRWLVPLIVAVLRAKKEYRFAHIVSNVGRAGNTGLSTLEYWNLCARVNRYKTHALKHWQEAQLDAVICPSSVLPALPHGYSKNLVPILSYTVLFNLLDCPAGIVPVTLSRADEAHYTDTPVSPLSAQQRKTEKVANVLRRLNNTRDVYGLRCDAALKDSKDLPVGVQVAALPFQDETCLRIMKYLEDANLDDEIKAKRRELWEQNYM